MDYKIDEMMQLDWEQVSCIYLEGINTGKATFQTEIPTWENWNNGHVSSCRLVARSGIKVLGWGALTKASSRCVYLGVAEVSLYIEEQYIGQGLGKVAKMNSGKWHDVVLMERRSKIVGIN